MHFRCFKLNSHTCVPANDAAAAADSARVAGTAAAAAVTAAAQTAPNLDFADVAAAPAAVAGAGHHLDVAVTSVECLRSAILR